MVMSVEQKQVWRRIRGMHMCLHAKALWGMGACGAAVSVDNRYALFKLCGIGTSVNQGSGTFVRRRCGADAGVEQGQVWSGVWVRATVCDTRLRGRGAKGYNAPSPNLDLSWVCSSAAMVSKGTRIPILFTLSCLWADPRGLWRHALKRFPSHVCLRMLTLLFALQSCPPGRDVQGDVHGCGPKQQHTDERLFCAAHV